MRSARATYLRRSGPLEVRLARYTYASENVPSKGFLSVQGTCFRSCFQLHQDYLHAFRVLPFTIKRHADGRLADSDTWLVWKLDVG